jgi:F-type H+-transporting ATPase subunit epsilon
VSTPHTMRVEIVTPERLVFEGESTMVVTRTLDGEIAFQPGHAPFLGALAVGATRVYRPDGSIESVAVLGGFVEVSGNRVSILADGAEHGDDIDLEHARRAVEEAEAKAIRDDDGIAEAELRRAHARLAAAGGL